MYFEYLKERANLDVIKTYKGFITYELSGDKCIINDWFVSKEYRKDGHGYFLANQVFEFSKELGIKTVYCESDEKSNGHELSQFTIYNFGFELYGKKDSINYYKMEVSEWDQR